MSATIAIVGTGDMGSGVGRDLVARGFRVVTALAGRGEASRRRAADAGIADAGMLADAVAGCDMLLSILPPAAAPAFAGEVAAAMRATGKRPVFVDCNAISPANMRAVGAAVAAAGAAVADVGIVGAPPGRGDATRFYASGPRAALDAVAALAGPDLLVRTLGPEIGRASALKMAYAAITKGTTALHAAALLVARREGLFDELATELSESRSVVWQEMGRSVPRLGTVADRWAGEMTEIAATFAAAGLTPLLHEGAHDVFALLARSALAAEPGGGRGSARTLDETLAAFCEVLDGTKDR
ncbi:MAG: DUF1932 domain-containing protein [Alphaproteobacteria bacterium]